MIHANLICRVERYDQETGIGDLEPLFLDDEGNPLPKIVNARAVRVRLKLPKRLALEDGTIYHTPINTGATSHEVTGGHIVVEYDEEDETQEVELWPHYKPGDIVFAAVPDRDLTDAVAGRKGNGDGGEAHELTAAIILGLVGGAS